MRPNLVTGLQETCLFIYFEGLIEGLGILRTNYFRHQLTVGANPHRGGGDLLRRKVLEDGEVEPRRRVRAVSQGDVVQEWSPENTETKNRIGDSTSKEEKSLKSQRHYFDLYKWRLSYPRRSSGGNGKAIAANTWIE